MRAFFVGLLIALTPSFAGAYTISLNTTVNSPGNVVNSCGFAANDTALCAQSFTTVGAGNLTDLANKLANDGGMTGTVSVSIQADSAGVPSGVALATSNAVAASSFTAWSTSCPVTNPVANTFTFASPPALSASTRYWAVISTSVFGSPTAAYRWCGDTSTAAGESAKFTSTNSSTWGGAGTGVSYFTATVAAAATANPVIQAFLILFGNW